MVYTKLVHEKSAYSVKIMQIMPKSTLWKTFLKEHVQISRKEGLNGQGQKHDHLQSQKLMYEQMPDHHWV